MPTAEPTRTPSKPLSPSLPNPATTRPSGSAPVVEPRDAGVVLETGQRPANARLELAFEQAVADHAPLAGHRLQREDPRPELRAGSAPVEAAEELVAAADREHRRAGADRLRDRLALPARSGAISACSRSWLPPM